MQVNPKYAKALLSLIAAMAVLCSSLLGVSADSADTPPENDGAATGQTENAYDTLIVMLNDSELDMSVFEGIDIESVEVISETPYLTVSAKLKYPGRENATAARELLLFNPKIGYAEVDGLVGLDPKEDVVPGDISQDGVCSAADIMLLRKHLVEPYLTSFRLYAADVNSDGGVNALDIMALRKLLVTLPA